MLQGVDWGKVPDSSIVESGMYNVQVEKFESTFSGKEDSDNRKLMFKSQMVIHEPAKFVNLKVFDMFLIGTNDDPEADLQETWDKTARRFKAVAKAAQVPLDQDPMLIAQALEGQMLTVQIEKYTEPATRYDGTPNAYAGSVRNRVQMYYPYGAHAPAITGSEGGKPLAPRPAGSPAPGTKAAAPVAAAKPASPAGARPVGRPPAAPVAAKPAVAARPAAPVAKGPIAPVAQAKPVATAKPKGQTVHCDQCSQNYTRADFSAHFDDGRCEAAQNGNGATVEAAGEGEGVELPPEE